MDEPVFLPCGHSAQDCDGGCDYDPPDEPITEADMAGG